MTLVVAWIGKDDHSYTSAYIASDSRVSWPDGDKYDCCRKTFFSKSYPELIGYCGDVLFPTLLLPVIIEAIDNGLLYKQEDNSSSRFEKFKNKLSEEISHYPIDKTCGSFEIIYVNREVILRGYPEFHAFRIKWQKAKPMESYELSLPDQSDLLCSMGSGSSVFNAKYEKLRTGKNKDTTRNIFHAFSLSLEKMTDKNCGGPPQLVGMFRRARTNGFALGIIYKKNRYFNGMRIPYSEDVNRIPWRNRNFEICDGKTNSIRPGSQKQPIDSGN